MKMDSKGLLGARLRKYRVENGYSQNHIANVLGIERSTYTYYEVGKTTPVIFDLMRLADLYGTNLDDLLGFHADSYDPLAFGEPRTPERSTTPRKNKDRYLRESVQDLSSEERQLLAYYRSATPSERKELLESLRDSRRKDQHRVL